LFENLLFKSIQIFRQNFGGKFKSKLNKKCQT